MICQANQVGASVAPLRVTCYGVASNVGTPKLTTIPQRFSSQIYLSSGKTLGAPAVAPETFSSVGDLLKSLRKRAERTHDDVP
jgi:hypothetical protein